MPDIVKTMSKRIKEREGWSANARNDWEQGYSQGLIDTLSLIEGKEEWLHKEDYEKGK